MRIGVVVPARDEEELLPACLASIAAAGRAWRAQDPAAEVLVAVAAGGCTDGTAEVARRAGVLVVETPTETVGAARRAAAEALGAVDWLACTDADSRVPADWLLIHAAAHAAGLDVLRGAVEPDRDELPAWAWDAWWARHTRNHDHPYVYGANLGIARTAYKLLGGFRPLAAHEDVDLVERARARGLRVASTGGGRVITSPRVVGRTSEGFAAWMADLLGTGVGLAAPTATP